jgi:DNA-binding MarR family transcriptional regulator
MHEKARLGILTCLLTHPQGLPFNEVKELCSLSDGNLSRHMRVLEDEKLVQMEKGFEGRKPKTLFRLTPEGRKRFLEYLEELEKVVKDASAQREMEKGRGDAATWSTA